MSVPNSYFYELGIAVDQLCNALLNGMADESISSRTYRAYRDGKAWGKFWMPIFDWIFSYQHAPQGHCRRAYDREMARIHLPPEMRV